MADSSAPRDKTQEDEVRQAERMVALGGLLAGLTHEINTPLGAINSNNEIIELAFRKVAELVGTLPAGQGSQIESGIKDMLDIIGDSIRTNRIACDRLVKIVYNVRNFARMDEAEWKSASIHDGIESTLSLLVHILKRRITVVKEFGAVRDILCFPNQLNQVFMNILTNAAQSIDGEGEIRIRTWEEGDSVRVAISDSGHGISPANLARIFEPGFTTKKPGLGTGIGLPICSEIIQNHNGRIEVESSPGHGSTFLIILPIAQSA